MVTGMSADPVLDALDALVAAIEENSERNRRVLERAEFLRTQRASGKSWSELVSEESRPLIVEMIGDNLDRLFEAGSRFRRAEAKALHDDGLTMDRIAELFGVTRQRVSALLKATRGSQ
jgi:HEAT repeat protein